MHYEVRIDSPWSSQRKILVDTDDPSEAILAFMIATRKAEMPLGPTLYVDGVPQDDEQLAELASEFITWQGNRWTHADPVERTFKHFPSKEREY